jgi:hypothetical protein
MSTLPQGIPFCRGSGPKSSPATPKMFFTVTK